MPFQQSQQAYAQSVGVTPTEKNLLFTRNPNSNDVTYPIGQFWQNTTNESLWYLNSFSSITGNLQATWVEISAVSVIETLSDTANNVVSPSSGIAIPPDNIQLTNLDGTLSIVSDPPNNRIIFAVSGLGLNWNSISTSQNLSVNNGYICTGGGALSLALPAVSSLGNTIEIVLNGSASFTITQSAGQQIRMGNQITTAGAGGSISSTQQGDWIELVCQTANLTWVANVKQGNLTFV